MPVLQGSLIDVTAEPSTASEVWVRAPRGRVAGSSVVVPETRRVEVKNGEFEVNVEPGPAYLVVVHATGPQEHVPLLVQEGMSTIAEAVRLGDESWADFTPSQADAIRAEVVASVAQARQQAQDAAASATAASKSAGAASTSEKNTRASAQAASTAEKNAKAAQSVAQSAQSEAKTSAEAAAASASSAKTDAGQASSSASAAAESAAAAGESETSAAESAQEATRQADRATSEAGRATEEADRAGQAAADSSVKAVADKVDELLAGAPEAYDTLLEIAEELERSQSAEAALVKEIAGKAPLDHTHTAQDVGAAPTDHTHTMAQVTGLQSVLDGKADKDYVDARSPEIQVVTNLPASPDPSTVYLVKE